MTLRSALGLAKSENLPEPRIGNDLIEAFIMLRVDGAFMDNEIADAEGTKEEAKRLIKEATPKERLEVYLEWNGILGYSNRIYELATGEL